MKVIRAIVLSILSVGFAGTVLYLVYFLAATFKYFVFNG